MVRITKLNRDTEMARPTNSEELLAPDIRRSQSLVGYAGRFCVHDVLVDISNSDMVISVIFGIIL